MVSGDDPSHPFENIGGRNIASDGPEGKRQHGDRIKHSRDRLKKEGQSSGQDFRLLAETEFKPKILITSEVGAVRPRSMWIIVVFPAPLGPRSPRISPGSTEKET